MELVNHSRVSCYGPNDYGTYHSIERCKEIIMDGESHQIQTINDAIEIGETKKVIECVPGAFVDMDLDIDVGQLPSNALDALDLSSQFLLR